MTEQSGRRMSRRRFVGALSVTALALSEAQAKAAVNTNDSPVEKKPNILLIVADDMGFSDIGCFGSEISTPNLDALASDGLKFTQFYNTARCWPSRACTLTGYYAQQVRRDEVPGIRSGGAGVRPEWAPLLPDLLKSQGYRSYHSGKWHVDGMPMQNGFDHSYSLNDHDRHFAPQLHTEDDVPLPAVKPDSGYYSTTAIANHAIRCLKEHAEHHSQQPFLQYLAFTSPHFPMHALADDIARYHGVYDSGWDAMRDARWERMQKLGVGGPSLSDIERELGPPYPFPEDIKKLGPDEVNRPVEWEGLSPSQRRFQTAKMEIHAAMVDRMDQEIGRVLEQVRAMGVMDNTIVIFFSDNGASAEMMVRGDGHDPTATPGTGATFLSIGPGWSSMCNTPLRRHKTWVHEGGISTPLIVHWPSSLREVRHGAVCNTPTHIVDIMPTLMEAAGAHRPARWKGHAVPRPPGKSLVPLITDEGEMQHRSLWWLHEGNRALRMGDWKIVAANKSPWELYNLTKDRAESHDLSQQMPERVARMARVWGQECKLYFDQALKDVPDSQRTVSPAQSTKG